MYRQTSLVLSSFRTSAVPEPATLGLLAMGTVSLLARRRQVAK